MIRRKKWRKIKNLIKLFLEIRLGAQERRNKKVLTCIDTLKQQLISYITGDEDKRSEEEEEWTEERKAKEAEYKLEFTHKVSNYLHNIPPS